EINVKDSKQRPITKTKKLKFTFKEQREYEMIDDVIAALEERLKSIENSIIIEASNYINLEELIVEKEKLEQELAEQMDRWVYLNDLAEQISMI
ncbi:MAG TPA: ABC transporter ATP-binding protein, partial [Clostridiales bacterium]|nr:ABC transporter ATP-binding protein [Clostridiales bacterium]